MTQLSHFSRTISRHFARLVILGTSQSRTTFLITLVVIALLLAQPLLVRAKPVTITGTQRPVSQLAELAELAQVTQTPEEEATEEPEEEATDEPEDEATEEPAEEVPEEPIEEATLEPTEEPTEIVEEAPASPASNFDKGSAISIPSGWQGEAAISAEQLGEIAPPLHAEVLQGQFQIAYVPAETGELSGGLLRILPASTNDQPASLRIGVTLDATSALIPFPAGQTLLVQLSARVYAPDATTQLLIKDNSGSSSAMIDGLEWSDYQVSRQIAPDATQVEVLVEWRNVPANGWLELRDVQMGLASELDAAALSPTDTPSVIEEVAIAPTQPPPTAVATSALPVATATPLPETVSGSEVISATPALVIVTSTPTPVDVFEEATRVAQATEWARILGPATATPANMATPTPTATPIVVTNTPVPANEATSTQMAVRATAIAFTTGTPTPIPPNAVIVVATATTAPAKATARPSATATPIFVLLDDIPVAEPTVAPEVPAILAGKIVFLSTYRGNPRLPNAMVMNPDGTGVGLLTTNYFYGILAEQDTFTSDGRFRAYSLRDAGGAAHNAGPIQIFYDDALYASTQHQATYFGDGVAWAPSWSPQGQRIVYVANETGNDEIWVSDINQWPAMQLTKNEWEWDHHPSFSPDGSEIVFSSNRGDGRRQLWIMSSNGENQRQLTNFPFEAWDPVWVKYVEPQQ